MWWMMTGTIPFIAHIININPVSGSVMQPPLMTGDLIFNMTEITIIICLKRSFPRCSEITWIDPVSAVWPIKCRGFCWRPVLFPVEIWDLFKLVCCFPSWSCYDEPTGLSKAEWCVDSNSVRSQNHWASVAPSRNYMSNAQWADLRSLYKIN
jgi:hypothetical protein